MKSQPKRLKVKDRVRVIKGPPDKLGKVGKVSMILANGAIIKLSKNWFTPIKFSHLEKINEKTN